MMEEDDNGVDPSNNGRAARDDYFGTTSKAVSDGEFGHGRIESEGAAQSFAALTIELSFLEIELSFLEHSTQAYSSKQNNER
jgi:hypothetical protein